MDSAKGLESEDAAFFAKDMLKFVEMNRNEDPVQVALSFFRSLATCTHVIGSSYPYIQESLHNRKSFIYCLHQAMQGYEDSEEITLSEFHAMLETIVPGFPRSVVLDVVLLATDNYISSMATSDTRFPVQILKKMLSFAVLYDTWIRVTEDIFRSESKNASALVGSIQRIRIALEGLQRRPGNQMHQPPLYAIINTLESYEGTRNGGEISCPRFLRSLATHDLVTCEINLLTNYPRLI